MGRRKNLSSVLVTGPGLLAIILMGLIASMSIWHQLKGPQTRERNDESHLRESLVNNSQWPADKENYRKWWRSPYKSQEIVVRIPKFGIKSTKLKVRRKKGLSSIRRKDGGQNNRRDSGWMMEPQDCAAWCNWCLITLKRRQHIPLEKWRKHIPPDGCTQFQRQEHCYSFLTNSIPSLSNKGRQNMTDCPNSFVMIIMILLTGLIVGHRGLWGVKCQFIGMLIVMRLPTNQGDAQIAQSRDSPESDSYEGIERYNAIMAGVICIFVGTVVLCVWLACSLRAARKYRRPDGIYLQLVTERLTETTYLGECLMPIDQVFQKNDEEPLIRELYVKHLCGTYIGQLVWGRQIYAIEKVALGRAINLSLPGSVNISRRMATALREDPRTVRMARLLRYTGGLASVIPVGMPMISVAGWSVIGGKDLREQDFSEFRPPVMLRSKSHRSSKLQRSVRSKKKSQERKTQRNTIEVIYEVPLTRSQESLVRPLPVRPRGKGLVAMEDITPV